MLHSPSNSTVEEQFTPYEIVTNSPLDDLIREVSVSPTEELLEKKTKTIIDNSSLNLLKKSTKQTNNQCKRKAKNNINPSKKKKSISFENVQKLKPKSNITQYIKMEPFEDDLPVISIPDTDFVEPEVLVYILNVIISCKK